MDRNRRGCCISCAPDPDRAGALRLSAIDFVGVLLFATGFDCVGGTAHRMGRVGLCACLRKQRVRARGAAGGGIVRQPERMEGNEARRT